MPRKIIHLDLDAFYASVEQLDDPSLRGKPVIVGGSEGRGVVCAASYEARVFGVRSAMAMGRARQLCPQAIVRSVRMARYSELSQRVFGIFGRFTDRVEGLSIDEAFLDVGGSERLFGSPVEIALRIKEEVLGEVGLRISAGVAPNKFLAKLATEAGKPDGLVEVTTDGVEAFLLPLPVRRLWGVGEVTARRLEGLGIRTVSDLRGLGEDRLRHLFGAGGSHLFRLARGEDDRPVEGGGEAKSVSQEETYERDQWDLEVLGRDLLEQAGRVALRLRRMGMQGRCVTVKVRYGNFETVTRSQTLEAGTDHARDLHRVAVELLGRTEAGKRSVRLLGLGASSLEAAGSGQAGLFAEEKRERLRALDRAVDQLAGRFGKGGVRPGSLVASRSGEKEGGDPGTGA